MLCIVSWNINGIQHALQQRTIHHMIENQHCDFLCLQETRCSTYHPKKLPGLSGHVYQSSYVAKRGYSGVMIVTRHKAIRAWYHFCGNSSSELMKPNPDPEAVFFNLSQKPEDEKSKPGSPDIDNQRDMSWNHQGRVITLEYPTFFLVNVYSPNSKSQHDYRINEWEPRLRRHVSYLGRFKPVVLAGDLNVIHTKRDSMNPTRTKTLSGSLPEEQRSMTRLLESCQLVDTYRVLHPTPHVFTWRSIRNPHSDMACRLDYILTSASLSSQVRQCKILYDVQGSDHVPIATWIRQDVIGLFHTPLTLDAHASFRQTTLTLTTRTDHDEKVNPDSTDSNPDSKESNPDSTDSNPDSTDSNPDSKESNPAQSLQDSASISEPKGSTVSWREFPNIHSR
jgi:exodeoxyribonuclease III